MSNTLCFMNLNLHWVHAWLDMICRSTVQVVTSFVWYMLNWWSTGCWEFGMFILSTKTKRILPAGKKIEEFSQIRNMLDFQFSCPLHELCKLFQVTFSLLIKNVLIDRSSKVHEIGQPKFSWQERWGSNTTQISAMIRKPVLVCWRNRKTIRIRYQLEFCFIMALLLLCAHNISYTPVCTAFVIHISLPL